MRLLTHNRDNSNIGCGKRSPMDGQSGSLEQNQTGGERRGRSQGLSQIDELNDETQPSSGSAHAQIQCSRSHGRDRLWPTWTRTKSSATSKERRYVRHSQPAHNRQNGLD